MKRYTFLFVAIINIVSCTNNGNYREEIVKESQKIEEKNPCDSVDVHENTFFLDFWFGMNSTEYNCICDALKHDSILVADPSLIYKFSFDNGVSFRGSLSTVFSDNNELVELEINIEKPGYFDIFNIPMTKLPLYDNGIKLDHLNFIHGPTELIPKLYAKKFGAPIVSQTRIFNLQLRTYSWELDRHNIYISYQIREFSSTNTAIPEYIRINYIDLKYYKKMKENENDQKTKKEKELEQRVKDTYNAI